MSINNIWTKIRNMQDNGFLDAALSLGGKVIWLDGYAGDDANSGADIDHPVKTLEAAYALGRDGKHDVIVVKNAGNSAALCTVRLDAAFTWAKNCLHLISQSPTRPMFGQRARIAPTATTTAFANFLTFTGNDCVWDGIQLWHGFNTGTTSAIALTLSGANRNRFTRCHIAGMADAASAQNAGSRSLKITGGGENLFEECVIGIDTVTRTAANSSIELAGATTRNVFKDCIFPVHATGSGTGALFVKAAAAFAMDRYNYFLRCIFGNPGALSGGVTLAAVATLAAATGGGLVFDYCSRYLVTDWGTDATSLAQIYVNGAGTGGTATDDVGRGAVSVAT